jgi:hypothetical protein
MTAHLTAEQQQALDARPETPLRLVDPRTNQTYVLLRAEVYERLEALLNEEERDQFVRDMYPHLWEVFGRAGWDDPAMDVYNDLDPREKP